MPRSKNTVRQRYPSGKLRPMRELATPTLVRRMIDQAKTQAGNPLLGSELGRLRLADKIDTYQLAAGVRYAEIVASWYRIKGVPVPFPRGATLQIGMGASLTADPPEDAVAAIGSAYKQAFEALRSAGHDAERAVVSVALLDRLSVQVGALKRGLSTLAATFQLTKSFR